MLNDDRSNDNGPRDAGPNSERTARPAMPLFTAALRSTLPSPKISLRLLLAALALSVCGLALIGVDQSISTTLRQRHLPGDLAKAINLSEVFGHSLGAAAILLSVWQLAPARRPAVAAAILITLTSGLVANAMKSCFVRVRPHSVDLIRVAEPDEYQFVHDVPGPRLSDGRELVPERLTDSRQRSFPSGHAATAWGLALGLSFAFPRGMLLFACFAGLASLQRITSGAHFPTDVLAGAAIAFAITALLLPLPPIKKLLSRTRET